MDFFREQTIDAIHSRLLDQVPSFTNGFETMEESAERFIKEYAGGDFNHQDEFGNTFLHYAIMYKNFDVAKFVLEKGADPNIKNKGGFTAMMYSVLYGDERWACLLLEFGGDPRIRDNFGVDSFGLSNQKEVTQILYAFYP